MQRAANALRNAGEVRIFRVMRRGLKQPWVSLQRVKLRCVLIDAFFPITVLFRVDKEFRVFFR